MEKLITVVVPIYNSEEYLRQCIDSILNQTHSNIELICVDDGSEDKSVEIISKYIEQDRRVRLLKQEHKGAGAARNMGMTHAKGEYIIFLDSDDFFDLSMFQKMYNRAEETIADIVMCGCKTYDNRMNAYCEKNWSLKISLLPEKEPFSKSEIPEHIFRITAGWAWDKLYRLDFVKRKKLVFQETMVVNDGLFVDLASVEAERIATVREQLVSYRVNHEKSITSRRFHKWHCLFEMFYAKREQLQIRGYYELVKKSYINNAIGLLWAWIEEFDLIDEYQAFYEATREFVENLELECYPSDFFDVKVKYELIREIKESKNAITFWLARKDKVIAHYQNYIDCVKRRKIWRFPLNEFKPGTCFIIYGYGDVGHDFCMQIDNASDKKLVAVVDQRWKEYTQETYDIIGMDEISNYQYDYIIVAILNKNIAQDIKSQLIEKNIEETKIKWIDLS